MPPRKFEASDKAQEPAALTKAITDQLRELISGSVPGLVDEYASATGLQLSEQFQADMTQAILASVLLHWDAPKRKRYSVLRKELARVKEQASMVASSLRSLQAALDNLTPFYRDVVSKGLGTPSLSTARDIERLSARAHKYANVFVDPGGVLKMLEFNVLVRLLAQAFERTSGRAAKVTLDPNGKYGGDFVELVETMLPLTEDCAKRFGWQMSYPKTTQARGKYIYDHTRAGRLIFKTSYHIS
jgi:hypothetical protein